MEANEGRQVRRVCVEREVTRVCACLPDKASRRSYPGATMGATMAREHSGGGLRKELSTSSDSRAPKQRVPVPTRAWRMAHGAWCRRARHARCEFKCGALA